MRAKLFEVQKFIASHVNMPRQKKMMHSFLAHILGNRPYNGKNMTAAHSKLDLNDEQFDRVLSYLRESLIEMNVSEKTLEIVMQITETTRNDVLA